MPLATLRQVLDEAARGGYGVGAFNVNNMEQLQGIVDAAVETASPVIVQASRGAIAYAGPNYLRHLIMAAAESAPGIPIVLHLDHGDRPETCLMAIELGFTSVMMDGSLLADGKTPSDYDYNVRVTREVAEAAHAKGVSVEGELGTLGGIEDGHGSGEVHLTDPDQAVDFVERTGVDALAVAIGTSHGAYKFTKKPDGEVLAMHLIEEIHTKLPETHMVMHGSSSVPESLVDRINAAGGKLEATFGVPVAEIQQGIRHGVRKVNVDTDGRLAITAALRESLNAHPSEFDPRAFFKPARQAMKEVVAERMTQFGSAGHAGDYEVLPLVGDGEAVCREPRRCLSREHRPAQHQHDPDADRRRRPGGAVRPSGGAARARPGRVPALHADHEAQPRRSALARPRPPRALGGSRLDAPLREPAPLGLRPPARPDQAVPPARLGDARPSRVPRHAGRRDDDRARSARGSETASGWRWRSGSCARSSARRSATTASSRICSDGDLMEGVASEAASLAGHLGLGRLVYLYDDNEITIDGPTSLSFSTEDVEKRFQAYGWHTLLVEDGNDLDAIEAALRAGIAEEERPTLIRLRTVIGYGSPRAGTRNAHSDPFPEEDVRATKEALGWDPDARFLVPDEVYAHWRDATVERGAALQADWDERFRAWAAGRPELAAEWADAWAGRPLPGVAAALPEFEAGGSISTRKSASEVMQAFGPYRADDGRRRGRPDPLDLHLVRRRARLQRRALEPERRLGRPRARDGRRRQRPRAPRRDREAVLLDLLRLHRLHAPADPALRR